MATDATGTPTAKGIPKYNLAVDPPSGRGFNAAMDSIDLLLDSYVPKPSGIVNAEVPVWNGTTWVRSSVTRIGTSSLGSGTPDSTKFLRGDGSWQIVGSGYGTSLPGSPTDGQEYTLVDSTTAPTYQWRFRYNAGSGSSYKWEFVGGTTLLNEVLAAEGVTTSGAFQNLTTTGPQITVPVAGEYTVGIGSLGYITASGGGGRHAYMSITGTTYGSGIDGDGLHWSPDGGGSTATDNYEANAYRTMKRTFVAETITVKYRTSASTLGCTWRYRHLTMTPIRVG
jgi:hypothetical protein